MSNYDIIKEEEVTKMREIIGTLRNEIQMVRLEDEVPEEDEVRVIDAIVDLIDLEKIGYKATIRKSEAGRPSFNPKHLLKLWLYGYRVNKHSGEELEEVAKYDIRAQWLIEKNKPDKTTINNFRQEQAKMLKNVFYEVNRILIQLGIAEIGDISQDGFKIKASNSKENNFTVGKILDRLERAKEELKKEEENKKKCKEKLKELKKGELGEEERKEKEKKEKELEKSEKKIKELKKRKSKHQRNFKKMQRKGLDQISLVDPDSKLMKNNGKFEVGYNIQTAVGVDNHITWVYEVGNNPADVGSMNSLMKKLRKEYKIKEVISNTTDKGYQSIDDMMKSLELGIIPQVTPQDREREEVVLEEEYEENEISNRELKSLKPKTIKKCLRAGKIPKCYEGVIEKIEKVEKRYYENGEIEENEKEERPTEETREEAIRNKIFVKDRKLKIVYCPQGERLTKKSINRKTGAIRYANKLACKNCKNQCTSGEYREVTMKENQTILYPKDVKKRHQSKKGNMIRKTVLKVYLKLNYDLIGKRMQTSEHSQGTMKTVGGLSSFSVRGKKKVGVEVSLYFSASNIRRACNIKSTEEILELLEIEKQKREKMSSIFVNAKIFFKICCKKICQAIFVC